MRRAAVGPQSSALRLRETKLAHIHPTGLVVVMLTHREGGQGTGNRPQIVRSRADNHFH